MEVDAAPNLAAVLSVTYLLDYVVASGKLAARDLVNLCLVSREFAQLITDDTWRTALRTRWSGKVDAVMQHADG